MTIEKGNVKKKEIVMIEFNRDPEIKKNKNDLGGISSGHTICSKTVNLDRTEAGLSSKWGKILPAVK